MAEGSRTHRTWTAREDNELLFYIQTLPIEALAQKLGRSVGSLRSRLYKRHGRSVKALLVRTHGMGTADVAAALDVPQKRVELWIRDGALPARRVRAVGEYYYSIDPEELTDWLYRGGFLFAIRPNRDWADIAAAARIHFERHYISRKEVAARLYASKPSIIEWERRRGFPLPSFYRLGAAGQTYYLRAAVRAWLEQHPCPGTLWEAVKDAPAIVTRAEGCSFVENGRRCPRPHYAQALCHRHYQRKRRKEMRNAAA